MPERTERPSHYSLRMDWSKPGEYLYRGFVQVPRGMTLGPDGNIYVADWCGRHIVVLGTDGSIADLGLWKNPYRWKAVGPHYLDFDSKGNLYIASYGIVIRVLPDGTVESITGHDTYTFGGVAINDQDQVFYTDRGEGEVFAITPEGERVLVASGIPEAEGMAFGLDGTLYVGQTSLSQVVQVDIETGRVEPFFSIDLPVGTIHMAVDQDGDIWIRGAGVLFQVNPEGIELPFWIGGEECGGESIPLATSGGIAFDKTGQMWIASYSSKIMRLSNPVPGEKDSWEAFETVFPGFETRTMAVDDQNTVYVPNIHTDELWQVSPGGNAETILEYGQAPGIDALVPNSDGTLFLGRSNGEVTTLDSTRTEEHFAYVMARSMTIGADGLLYAISANRDDGSLEVVRISGVDDVEVITNEIGGYILGAGPYQFEANQYVKIEPAMDQGLYLYDATYHALLYLDFDGVGRLIHELTPVDYANLRVAVAPDGTVYRIDHEDYDVHVIYPDGRSEIVAWDLYGDPEALSVSKDGEWLLVAENGAIDMIPIR